ncbi:hypothetical protein BpHYR1_013713 [Brachionus plicatilis]|uniref:Uncharacterized protein n=1 Tax=Brachionus plicatilis TaxID=10195 RepID=A0A3M7QCX5_BRAPC|nr:hypothetical protein BpHYR1_013713 [Brachionus plicatilis]
MTNILLMPFKEPFLFYARNSIKQPRFRSIIRLTQQAIFTQFVFNLNFNTFLIGPGLWKQIFEETKDNNLVTNSIKTWIEVSLLKLHFAWASKTKQTT